jgi:hypothetical protein
MAAYPRPLVQVAGLDIFLHFLIEQRLEVFTFHYLSSFLLIIVAYQYIIIVYLYDFYSDSLIW